MTRLRSGWVVCVVMSLGSLNAGQVRAVKCQLAVPGEESIPAGSDHQTAMTVWVYNRYPVPAELLKIALRHTEVIFEHAGIRIVWLGCLAGPDGTTEAACLPGPRSNTMVLTILGHANGRYRRSLGYTFQRDDGGKSMVVYYRRAGFMVEWSNFAPRLLLNYWEQWSRMRSVISYCQAGRTQKRALCGLNGNLERPAPLFGDNSISARKSRALCAMNLITGQLSIAKSRPESESTPFFSDQRPFVNLAEIAGVGGGVRTLGH